MTLRDKLQFSYDGQVLAEACAQRRSHHEKRRELRETELEKARAAFRDAGVEFQEYPVTGRARLPGMQWRRATARTLAAR
jgi:hypothetical protein